MIDFSLTSFDTPQLSVLRCSGELDLASAPALLDAVDKRLPRAPMIIDLEQVTFIDCSGLAAMETAHRRGRALGRVVSWSRPSLQVLRLLSVTQTLDDLEIHSCLSSAKRAALRVSPRRDDHVLAPGAARVPIVAASDACAVEARAFARAQARRLGWTEEAAEAAALVVSELLAEVAKAGRRAHSLTAQDRSGLLLLEVASRGRRSEPRRLPDAGVPISSVLDHVSVRWGWDVVRPVSGYRRIWAEVAATPLRVEELQPIS